jgi:hypothetical protein
MSDWENEIHQQVERDGIPPLQQLQPPSVQRPAVTRLSSKQRRQMNQPTSPTYDDADQQQQQPASAQPAQPYRPMMPQRPLIPRLDMPRQPQQQQEDDPFAVHQPSYQQQQQQQQPFVHPLMSEPLGRPQSYAEQQQQYARQQSMYNQQPQQSYPASSYPASSGDPQEMQRIQNTLRDTLNRDPSLYSQQNRSQLPPLSRPAIPPLKLGDAVQKVLGPKSLITASQPPAEQNKIQADLRDKVARMKLHESINPAAAHSGDPMAGLEADKAQYLSAGATIEYDENDEDDVLDRQAVQHGDEQFIAEQERRPLSPGKKQLPTSRLPIDEDDLARRPDELRGQLVSREELMHFRRNQALASQITGGSAASISNAPTGAPGSSTLESSQRKKEPVLQETFVESKTTGEFIRVRQAPLEDGQALADAHHAANANVHNIHDFDAAIDTIVDSVNTVQSHLSSFWLMISGLLVGACLLQVYMVYLKTSDRDFLSYYSVLSGPARKVIYVLIGFSSTLACWRFSLERYDPDRHLHFIHRYHAPNAHPWIWLRNVLCATVFLIGFLMTLIMVPLDDYMEDSFRTNPTWYVGTADLPDYFTSRIISWYAMSMVRLVCASIGWLCLIHRFGRAEFQFLQLAQEKFEKRQLYPNATAVGASGVAGAQANTGFSRTATSGSLTGRSASSRGVSSQRQVMQATNNGGAMRMEPLNASAMQVPPRR